MTENQERSALNLIVLWVEAIPQLLSFHYGTYSLYSLAVSMSSIFLLIEQHLETTSSTTNVSETDLHGVNAPKGIKWVFFRPLIDKGRSACALVKAIQSTSQVLLSETGAYVWDRDVPNENVVSSKSCREMRGTNVTWTADALSTGCIFHGIKPSHQ